jgi:hypothetical protein
MSWDSPPLGRQGRTWSDGPARVAPDARAGWRAEARSGQRWSGGGRLPVGGKLDRRIEIGCGGGSRTIDGDEQRRNPRRRGNEGGTRDVAGAHTMAGFARGGSARVGGMVRVLRPSDPGQVDRTGMRGLEPRPAQSGGGQQQQHWQEARLAQEPDHRDLRYLRPSGQRSGRTVLGAQSSVGVSSYYVIQQVLDSRAPAWGRSGEAGRRTGRDSNPRNAFDVYTLSRRTPRNAVPKEPCYLNALRQHPCHALERKRVHTFRVLITRP